MREAEIAVAWDARLGGRPVALLGIESRPLPRFGCGPGRRARAVDLGHAVPARRRRRSRARSTRRPGRRPLVVLANLAGFDGSPESMRRLQLEYGAEIGRAIVNFDGPIAFCVISRFHGGAFVVFSRRLNDDLETIALEGAHASVIGGAPAAAVVFARDVDARTREDARIAELDERLERRPRTPSAGGCAPSATSCGPRCARRSSASWRREFDAIHSVAARGRGRLGRPRDRRRRAARRPDRHDRARRRAVQSQAWRAEPNSELRSIRKATMTRNHSNPVTSTPGPLSAIQA